MKLKSYFSATVEAAMELARKELGEEALLVNARPATPETRHLGAYEVVFGLSPRGSDKENASLTSYSNDRLAQDVSDMKREIQRMARSLRGSSGCTGEPGIYSHLVANELDAALAQSVSEGTPFEELFETDSTLGRRGAARSVVALVGPPGVGKTTTLIKLA